ncbi:GDP dissociation inhibitor [Annulohypoxylon truncatum]|uniref:GDP dissociation inhibitor n=1 Tax=Annulohypoxylon truncatum TaxID=327061 RepID=UPI002007734C|nr:GDP dissociation inhibitor [Annulohypoxylon truncatum]KAI1211940.1 GDP dissociation inhibitor [Annulohypoxylon truncatum]
MESLGEEPWDVVICGTGLQQSLLALALSRSKKRILHVDPNDYYGEFEAAFSLQEADSWAAGNGAVQGLNAKDDSATDESKKQSIFRNALAWTHPEAKEKGLSFPRAYSLALAPHIIHTCSKLLSQLVSSRAYRQVEFLAVGSFFVYDADAGDNGSKLARIPSSREDVFSTQSIPVKSKRSLMKFLKFVIDYDSEEQKPVWQGQEQKLLSEFLATEFKLDENLRKYILALTLTLDGRVKVIDGLATIHRHLTSMGLFGPGFCAVYPKWGGSSEIAQVACRAGAVGGGVYMLDTKADINDSKDDEITLKLSNDVSIRTTRLVTLQTKAAPDAPTISRLVAVVSSPLEALFEVVVEGAPTPAVAVVAFPGDSTSTTESSPIYALVHSSETGECPTGQSVIYLATLATPQSTTRLNSALDALLSTATPADAQKPTCLYKLSYEQSLSSREPSRVTRGKTSTFAFPSPSLSLAFDDGCLDAVQDAWKLVMGDDGPENEYMVFQDREGVGDDDEVYE